MSTEVASQVARYRLWAADSKFTAQAFAEGLFSVFGHDPIIGIKDFEGEATFVSATFENASLELRINAASLSVIDNVKPKDRDELERTMRDDVLEVSKFPDIIFKSTNVTLSRIAEGRYRVRVIGDLTLHGVTQTNLWISGEVLVTDGELRAKGKFPIRQTDYKIKPVSVAGGTLKVKNEVKCTFDIVARGMSDML
jgi:polyisoprenoid-binding protein YceI